VPSAPLLEVRGLTVDYDTEAGPVRAVDDFDLDIRPGEFVGVVGESGCGKTTMLFGVAQLLSPPALVSWPPPAGATCPW
jgi:peptide/nickel transport system ATP-binding protein